MSKKKVSPASTSHRLSPHVRPERYRIHIEPDIPGGTFVGTAHIDLLIAKPTREIHFHANELVVHGAELESSENLKPHTIGYDIERESVVLHFEQPVSGAHTLALDYAGKINEHLVGFYRSTYTVKGETRHLATTQFEATDARRAFPCIDEPSHKATYELSFTVEKQHTVISNTHETAMTELENGKRHIQFAPTPKMSSYLAAFVVGEFEHLEGRSKRGVRVRVNTTPGKKHQGAYALDVTLRILDFYETYFGVPYPLDTLDLIAIPDFSSAAMENWGAITFREPALLVDSKNSSSAIKQRVVEVIAHELAHMWFGNLVTMEWWTHLWLNEGFATWMSYNAMDHLFPEWRVWTQFISNEYAMALELDGLTSTHAIEIPVKHPREIREIFDTISYLKGASVIRMIADYLGEKKFRAGLRLYMLRHAYGNTETEDLWDALSTVSGEDVRAIMKEWTGKPGYPLVKIKKHPKGLLVEQERFFASEVERKVSKDGTLWKIPTTISIGKETKLKRLLLGKKRELLPIDWDKSSWVKLNFKHSTLCRTHYDEALFLGVKEAKFTKELKARDRIGFLGDLMASARSGVASNNDLVQALNWFADERYYTIWVAISGTLGALSGLLSGTSLEPAFKEYARGLYSPVAHSLGWKSKRGEGHLEAKQRGLIIGGAGIFGVPEIVREARARFEAHAKHKKQIEPDLRSAVYATVALHGGEKEWKQMLALYDETELQEEKSRLAQAMVLFRQPKLIARSISFAVGPKVRLQDSVHVLVAMARGNDKARQTLWNYLETNWEKQSARFQSGLTYFARLINALLSGMTGPGELQEAEQFLKKHMWKGGERAVAQAIENGKANTAWKKRAVRELKSYFTKGK